MTDQYFTWDVDEALRCIDLQYAQGAARVRTYFTHDADMHQVRRDDVFNTVHKYVTHALDGDRWAYIRSDYTGPTWLQSTGPDVYDSFLSFCLIADPDWSVAPNQCYTYDALGSEFAPEERSDAFGTGGGLGLEFGYRDYLSTTALYQLWHRWYDPATGRFVSREPSEEEGAEAYQYVWSAPANWTDPTGLRAPARWGAAGDAWETAAAWAGYFWDALIEYYITEPAQMRDDPCYDRVDCLDRCIRDAAWWWNPPWAGGSASVLFAPLSKEQAVQWGIPWTGGSSDITTYYRFIRIRYPWTRLPDLAIPFPNWWPRSLMFLRKAPYMLFQMIFAAYAGNAIGSWVRCLARCR